LFENIVVDQDGVDEHYNLDIFEMTTSTNERGCQQGIFYIKNFK
jgi:hypothetical protein